MFRNRCLYRCVITFISCVFYALDPACGHGQTLTIQGAIRNEKGEALEFVNVFVKGTIKGTSTDERGEFALELTSLSAADTLVCSFIGFESYVQSLAAYKDQQNAFINITLRDHNLELKPIQITASSYSTGDENGVTLSSLEVIKTPGGNADIMWALQTFPGVQTVEDGAGLFIRGGDVSETVVLMDGSYLFNPYRFQNPNGGYFGIVSPFVVKNIYFSTGGFGVEFGNSISGTLDLKSQDIPEKRSLYFSLGLASSGLKIEAPLKGKKIGFGISANYSNSKGLFKLNGHNREFEKYPVSYDVNFNMQYKYSSNGFIKIFFIREGDRIGVSIDDPTQLSFFNSKNTMDFGSLYWQHKVSPRLTLNGNLAMTRYSQDQGFGTGYMFTKNHYYQGRIYVDYQIIPDKLQSKFGVDVFDFNKSYLGEYTEEVEGEDSLKTFDYLYTSKLIAAYNKYSISLGKNINYTVGFRFEYQNKSDERLFDFRNALTWALSNSWNLVGSFGRYHQFPDPDYYDERYGNPKLKSFAADHSIVGIAHEKKNLIFRMEFYYKKYLNLLLQDDSINFTNQGYGYARGVDCFFKLKFKKVDTRISLSYLDTKRKWEDSPYLSRSRFDVTWNLVALTDYKINSTWSISSKYRFATGKPYTSSLTTYHDKRVSDFHQVDLLVNFTRSFFTDNLTVLYLAVNNVLGTKNVFGYNYSEDYSTREPIKAALRRSFYFGIQFSL